MLYQICDHLTLGPMALVLGDYKSDIALVGCYNVYIYYTYIIHILCIIILYIILQHEYNYYFKSTFLELGSEKIV